MDLNGISQNANEVSGSFRSQHSNATRSTIGNSSLNTNRAKSSAFDRIFKNKNLQTHMLPEFLKPKGKAKSGLTLQILQTLNLNKPQNSDVLASWISSDSQNEEFSQLRMRAVDSFSNRLRLTSEKIEQIRKIEEILADIFNPDKDPNEEILWIRNQSLTRSELRSFNEPVDLPEKIVNMYMRMLKASCKRKKAEMRGRVLISRSDFSEEVFSGSKNIIHSKENILNYNYLCFPLLADHWTLLVLNTKEKQVYYYDPFKEHLQIHNLLNGLFNFLRGFLVIYHNTTLEESEWRNLFYVPSKLLNRYEEKDSGVYVCMKAELIINDNKEELPLEDYRKDMLVNLVKASLE